MSLVDNVLDGVDKIISWVSTSMGQMSASFCDLETSDISKQHLIMKDGSIVTIVRLDGTNMLVGDIEFRGILDTLNTGLSAYMAEGGHKIQVYFIRDPDSSSEVVTAAMQPFRATAKAIGLDFDDVLDDQEKTLASFVAGESVYFALWTTPAALSRQEAKYSAKNRLERNRRLGLNHAGDVQNIAMMVSELRDRHQAFAGAVMSDFTSLGMLFSALDAYAALRAIRYSNDPELTPADYRPSLVGDKPPVRKPAMGERSPASLLWPSLAGQVLPRDAEIYDFRTVRVGDRIYAPLYIDIQPRKIQTFTALFQRILDSEKPIPWRISFLIDGNGIGGIGLQSMLVSLVKWSNRAHNNPISDSLDHIKAMANEATTVQLRVCLTTWAPYREIDLLRARTARLAKAVIGWGECEVRELSGDPLEAFVSTSLCMTKGSVATPSAAPLTDVLPMLPITRPASLWSEGAVLFTSDDYKLMPFQPGSSLQDTWIALFFAGPGSGKSMLMAILHKATVLSPQNEGRLPYIAILDIGPSSSGFISLIKNALPMDQQHLVNHYRMQNTKEFAVNPFTTQLGCRHPTPEELAAMCDIMTMLLTPAESGTPRESISEMVSLVVEEMFRMKSDSDIGHPNSYETNVEPDVDKALLDLSWDRPTDHEPSWWEVEDYLFANNRIREAHFAHRQAMPLLHDAAEAVRTPAIQDIYSKVSTGSKGMGDGEGMVDYFGRGVQEAVREYQIMSVPTRFEIGDSRITAIDLEEVAKSGGPMSQKRTAVMYTICMFMLARDYTLTNAALSEMPAAYRDYHFKRIQDISQTLKTLCLDEFHRTGSRFSQPVRERVKVYMREGRKWKIQIMLASQQLRDFDEEMVSMATNVYMMETPAEQEITNIKERFGLTDTEVFALRHRIRSPRPGGGTFFCRIKTKQGVFKQLLRPPVGSIEMWANSTTKEDAMVREICYKALGPKDARRALAICYPGLAQKEVENRRKEAMRDGSINAGTETGVVESIANSVIDFWRNHTRKVA